jgi:hypothetical protein
MTNINKIMIIMFLMLSLVGCTQSPSTEHTGEYNMSLVSNNTGFITIMQKVNSELMLGHFGNMILISLGAILFMAFLYSTRSPAKSFAAMSYILFVSVAFMRVLELVGDEAVWLILVIAAISTASLFYTRS